jgi:hypothetical protein
LIDHRRLALAWSCLAAATACDGKVCSDDGREDARLATVQKGSLRLSGAGETSTIRLRAVLSGLPELWNDWTLPESSLDLGIYLGYESAPFGGDARTEMPSFTIDLEPVERNGFATIRTPPLPQNPFTTRHSLFEPCAPHEDGYCCPFGEPECSLPVTIRVQRAEGTPFPPVVVQWYASAAAHVNSCPEPNGAALALELEAEEP